MKCTYLRSRRNVQSFFFQFKLSRAWLPYPSRLAFLSCVSPRKHRALQVVFFLAAWLVARGLPLYCPQNPQRKWCRAAVATDMSCFWLRDPGIICGKVGPPSSSTRAVFITCTSAQSRVVLGCIKSGRTRFNIVGAKVVVWGVMREQENSRSEAETSDIGPRGDSAWPRGTNFSRVMLLIALIWPTRFWNTCHYHSSFIKQHKLTADGWPGD